MEASSPRSAATWFRLRCRRAIGQLGNRTHAKSLGLVGGTGGLQVNRLVETPSVAMNQLNPPALYGALAPGGLDEPAGGGGMVDGRRVVGPQEHPHPATPLGGELEAADLDAGER